MKMHIAVTIFILAIVMPSQAQTTFPINDEPVLAWIRTYDAQRQCTGVLYEVNDSSVTLSNRSVSRNGSPWKLDMTKIDIRSIDVIKIRKNGNVGRGVLYGAISGLVFGGVMGILYYSSVEKSEAGANALEKQFNSMSSTMQIAGTAIIIGVGCIGTGIGIGAAIGSAKITIPVNGNQEQFILNKSFLNTNSATYIALTGSKTFSKLKNIVVDIDGNLYHTLALGGQVWMAEDLKVSHYQDGSEISDVIMNNDGGDRKYNWNAVSDSNNICPAGWHVPSQTEWNSLFNSLGGENGAVGKLGESFSSMGQFWQWWSSTESDIDKAMGFYLNYETAVVMFTNQSKTSGMSVRCIRDI